MISIKKMMLVTILAAAGLGLFGAGFTDQAFGHETRIVGSYKMVIGFRNEPAFVDEPNAIDVILSRASDDRPIDRSAGDVVDLQVEVQLRDREAFESRILRSADLEDPLKQAYQTTNRYNAWFKPTVAGTYAYHVTGVISDASDPQAGPQKIDQTFVCGRGTLDPDGHGFNCVAVPQAFPGRRHKD